jgi:hypothetical protein
LNFRPGNNGFFSPGHITEIVNPTATDQDKYFRWRASKTFGSIADGLSNTVMFAEKWVCDAHQGHLASPGTTGGGSVVDDHNTLAGKKFWGDGDVFDARYEWSFLRVEGSWIQRDSTGEHNAHWWGSNHPEVWNVVLGDGSVRSLNFRVDHTLSNRLINAQDRGKIDWELISSY